MRVWLIKVGEPLPIDGTTNERLHRTGILANRLVQRGHKVVWWTSTFDHVRKIHRFNSDSTINESNNFKVKLLHSIGYKKNVSIFRFVNHYLIGCKFYKYAQEELKPTIILSSLPTLKLSLASVKYGNKKGVPVVLDIRDIWPDVFLDYVPSLTKRILSFLLFPIYNILKAACSGATAITGVTPDFIEWGVSHAHRLPTDLDKAFPFGYSKVTPDKENIEKAEKFWKRYGLSKDNNEFIVCFFGAMSSLFDLKTVIEAAGKLKLQKRKFRIVLCGSGNYLTLYKNLAKDCENIVFPGWVGAAEIWTLMRMSAVGLAPYFSIKNFTMNLPNKPIEYLSAGLPIVSSLKGVLENLLSTYNCGVTYKNSDVDNLVSILIDLYDHRDQLEIMSKNAYALYKDKFVAEKVYDDMISYLEYVSSSYLKDKV